MYVYSCYFNSYGVSRNKGISRTYAHKNPKKTSTIAPVYTKEIVETKVSEEIISEPETQLPTSPEVEYYAGLHRMLTSKFLSDYSQAMAYARLHPEEVVTISTTGI